MRKTEQPLIVVSNHNELYETEIIGTNFRIGFV